MCTAKHEDVRTGVSHTPPAPATNAPYQNVRRSLLILSARLHLPSYMPSTNRTSATMHITTPHLWACVDGQRSGAGCVQAEGT
jgi:hypothetical protein